MDRSQLSQFVYCIQGVAEGLANAFISTGCSVWQAQCQAPDKGSSAPEQGKEGMLVPTLTSVTRLSPSACCHRTVSVHGLAQARLLHRHCSGPPITAGA